MPSPRPRTRTVEDQELQEGLCEVYETEAWEMVLHEIERVVGPVRSGILDGTRNDYQTLQGMKKVVTAIYTAAGADVPEAVQGMFK